MPIKRFVTRICFLVAAHALLSSAVCARAQNKPAARPAASSFSRDVLPIFRTACAGCHNGEMMAGGLNLTSYMAALKGGRGGPLLTAGKGADSRLTKYLTGALKPQMPPGGGLRAVDVDKIRLWIDAGAKADALPELDKRPDPRSTAAPSAVRTVSSIAPSKTTAFVLNRNAPVTALAFAPDGKILAVGAYREVQFWNLETKQIAARWTGHPDTIRSLVYSKDGKWLAAGGGVSGAFGEARLWNVAEAKETLVLKEHTDTVNAVAFNPDGTKLASASADKMIKTWDLVSGKVIATGKDHSDAVWGISWSPDGKYIASCGADRSIKIWDAQAMKRLYSLSGHEDVVYSVEFSADSKSVLSSSADRTARTWNIGADGGAQAEVFSGHEHSVLNASYAQSGGGIVTASADKTVRTWKGAGNRTFTGAGDWVYVARFSRDQQKVAGGDWDGSVYLWNAADGKLIAQFSTRMQPGAAAKPAPKAP